MADLPRWIAVFGLLVLAAGAKSSTDCSVFITGALILAGLSGRRDHG